MPIPAFRSDGKLPPGLPYVVTWAEIKKKYGYNDQRREMLETMASLFQILADFGCKRVWIDGGFVSSSISPKDYDCCYDATGMNSAAFEQHHRFLAHPELYKELLLKLYGGEIYASDKMSKVGVRMFEFFQLAERIPQDLIPPRTRVDERRLAKLMKKKKGILELSLHVGWRVER